MKVTYSWLKDFVEIKIPARKLAEKLTMAGLEATSLEERNGDFVFEFEITSNRPDLLSVIGIAREVAAITGKKLKPPHIRGLRSATRKLGQVSIKIENKKDCPLYTARIISGIKVGLSPDWLKRRLELVGLRSVNNIVDITNYVLMETGQPLHAFDLGKVKADAIFVRRAREKEKIVLIDEVDGIYGTKDRGAVPTILDLIKSTQFPIIMCSNEYKQSLQPLYNKIRRFEVHSLSDSETAKIAKSILKKENIISQKVGS